MRLGNELSKINYATVYLAFQIPFYEIKLALFFHVMYYCYLAELGVWYIGKNNVASAF